MRKILHVRIIKIALIGGAILILLSFARHTYNKAFSETEVSTEEGVAKIKELESADISSIKKEIESNEVGSYDKENSKGEVDFKKVFDDSVIMSDSRGEALTEYDILSPSSVVAYKGRTVVEARDDVQTVVDLSPSNVFLTYGMNDLLLFNNSKDFVKNYETLIKDIKRKLPNSKIYVTSIIPTTEEAMSKKPAFRHVDSFNKALEDMCKDLNVEFIDVSASINSGSNLYEPDGIHFKSSFYDGYLTILKEEANL